MVWILGTSAAGKNSWMFDKPRVSPSYRVASVMFQAVAKVKCIEGNEAGAIYATVEWFYYAPAIISIPVAGPIHSVPMRITVGGITSIE